MVRCTHLPAAAAIEVHRRVVFRLCTGRHTHIYMDTERPILFMDRQIDGWMDRQMDRHIYLYMYTYIYIYIYIIIYIYIYLFPYIYVCMYVYVSIYLPTYVCKYLSIHLSIHPSIYLSIYLSIDPSIYPSIHLSIDLSLHTYIHVYICRQRGRGRRLLLRRAMRTARACILCMCIIYLSIYLSTHPSIYLSGYPRWIQMDLSRWIERYVPARSPSRPRLRPPHSLQSARRGEPDLSIYIYICLYLSIPPLPNSRPWVNALVLTYVEPEIDRQVMYINIQRYIHLLARPLPFVSALPTLSNQVDAVERGEQPRERLEARLLETKHAQKR